jgi:hypothetical protein
MEWSHSFCLFCDKQTVDAYCSQTCKLADLEKFSAPESHEYSMDSSEHNLPYTTSKHNKSHTQLQLPPPFNFSAYRQHGSRQESPPVSPRGYTQANQSHQYHQYHQTHPSHQSRHSTNTTATHAPNWLHRSQSDYARPQPRSLNTSTSRSSLSSITSTSTAQGLSDQAMTQLQNYSNSFDHVRDWKRRITVT